MFLKIRPWPDVYCSNYQPYAWYIVLCISTHDTNTRTHTDTQIVLSRDFWTFTITVGNLELNSSQILLLYEVKLFGSKLSRTFCCKEGQYLARIKFQIVKEIGCADAILVWFRTELNVTNYTRTHARTELNYHRSESSKNPTPVAGKIFFQLEFLLCRHSPYVTTF